jgi:hypothetical protein
MGAVIAYDRPSNGSRHTSSPFQSTKSTLGQIIYQAGKIDPSPSRKQVMLAV